MECTVTRVWHLKLPVRPLKMLVSKSGISFSRGLFSMANCFFRWRTCVSFPVEKSGGHRHDRFLQLPQQHRSGHEASSGQSWYGKRRTCSIFSQQFWDGVETQMMLYMVWYIHTYIYILYYNIKHVLTIPYRIFDTSRLYSEGKHPKKSAAEIHLGTPTYLFQLKGRSVCGPKTNPKHLLSWN